MAAQDEPKCRYDVFLSFRGPDTRHTFTGYLYDALIRKGYNTFMDDEGLKGGEQVPLSLDKAIEESRISVVVFSENYAFSSWCLDELVKILESMKRKNQLVWPIFYKVQPSDVRHQRNSYGKAMEEHETRFRNDLDKVHKWRAALTEVANLKGWHFKTGYEYEFIQSIVKKATPILNREQLYVGEHVIGHQSRIEEVKSLLHIESRNTVCMLGIHGTGGIGKTTLAKALYNLIVDQFECAIFLDSVRERSTDYMGLVHLQEAILSKLFEGDNIKLNSVDEGVTRLKDKLCHTRVLLVLDDVDNEDQLEKLAGECDWFGSGSRIIITTRDKHLLIVHQIEKRYEMKELNDHEGHQVFCWNAFKMVQPATNYEDVSYRAVGYANGLPLALKVIGSNLVGKSVEECECALDQYERIPERKIQGILKVSYDSLEDNAKYVFLDIACFFKGERLEYVEKVLDRCDFFPTYNIGILVDKSLLTIENGVLRMHDLIEDMGKEIVRLDAPSKPGERSRLWFYEDVLTVLTENSGSSNIEGIILNPPEKQDVEWSGTAFEKMNNLRILIVRKARFSSEPTYLPNSLRLLDWAGYPWESLPTDFYPRNAVVLSLPHSHLRLEMPLPQFVHLTFLDFTACQFITRVPDVSGVPNLRELGLDWCENLIAFHHSVGFLKNLVSLSASSCKKLRTFLPRMWLPSLQSLHLFNTRIEIFPDVVGTMDKLSEIYLMGTRIKALPHSIGSLTGLEIIDIDDCKNLRDLPCDLFMLPKIVELFVSGHKVIESFRRFGHSRGHVVAATRCPNLDNSRCSLQRLYFYSGGLTDEDLHLILSCFPNLEELVVPNSNFVSFPPCIKESAKLTFLDVSCCKTLQEIPDLPLSIQNVKATNCPSLTSETSRMLWSLAFKEASELEVIMPETQIPDWFDHRCEGEIVSFWARRKFPAFAFAFIFDGLQPVPNQDRFLFWLYINGQEALQFNIYNDYITQIVGDHVIIIDLRSRLEKKWPILETFLVNEWNYVEFIVKGPCSEEDELSSRKLPSSVSYCGAYVYKQETNMEDIRFTCSNSLKRKRVRKFKPKSGRGKDNKRAKRRLSESHTSSSRRRRIKKIALPMTKLFWRFLSNRFR